MFTDAFNERALLKRDDAWDTATYNIRLVVAEMALGSVLYGVFVVLAIVAFYVLLCNWPPTKVNTVLAVVLFILFASTTVHCVTNILGGQATLLLDAIAAFSTPLEIMAHIGYVRHYYLVTACGRMVALTINVLLADAIVWWRACVLWRANWPVRLLCVALLMATAALGGVTTSQQCYIPRSWTPENWLTYYGVRYGIAATSLSLVTNVVATSLVGYKLWKHRHILKKYVVIGSSGTRVEKVLSLLVESGVIYCIILVFVLVWQSMAGVYTSLSVKTTSFYDHFLVFIGGGLVPTIAIYPTLIIVLVALGRSEFDSSLRARAQHQHEVVTIETTTTTLRHYDHSLSDASCEYGMLDRDPFSVKTVANR